MDLADWITTVLTSLTGIPVLLFLSWQIDAYRSPLIEPILRTIARIPTQPGSLFAMDFLIRVGSLSLVVLVMTSVTIVLAYHARDREDSERRQMRLAYLAVSLAVLAMFNLLAATDITRLWSEVARRIEPEVSLEVMRN
jgi:NADH:ubiquinone oxidoreductase subunit 4 (subunit M)